MTTLSSQLGAPEPEPAPALRVLVVEDNAADAMVAEAAVIKAGRGTSTVLRAESLAQALGIVASNAVHMVLLDLNLPDSRGLETVRSMCRATRCPVIVVTADDQPGLDEEVLEQGAFEILHKGGMSADAIARLLRLAEAQHRAQALVESTERRYLSAEKTLEQLARFDATTGLANRNLLQERVEHAIAQSRRRGRGAGVLFVNLDRFKLVNDTYGHHVGDEMLRLVGARLTSCVRREDTVSRLGGDEFAVLIADLARPDDAAIVAQKILNAFVAPFDLGGRETFITASIGVATFPGDGEGTETLLKCADVAMYRAKESSRNAFCFYTAEMNARAASKLQLNTDLRHAVERGEFRLHYQPKVNIASGEMIGMEALLRWQHAQRGIVPPLEFIPALEDSGMILAVGDWVVEEACRQLRQWQQAGLRLTPVAVNLSAKQFRRRDLDKVIHRILSEHGVSPALLELEVTESCLMDDPKDAIRQLQALREAGIRISVDDFGTGYSSLAYLTRLPLSTLKIDRGFVNAATTEPGSAAIVKMVIDMAHRLNFDVVAEGIETEQQVAFLMQHGCEQGQGYHFGRPVSAEDIAPRLQRK